MPSHRSRGICWGLALLAECKEVRVYADEITEGMMEEMMEEIKAAKKLNIPIKFYNSEMEHSC